MAPGYLPEYLPEYELGARAPTGVLPEYDFGYPSTYPSISLVVPECLPEYELVPEYILEYLPEYDSGGTRIVFPSMTKITKFGTSGTPGYILYVLPWVVLFSPPAGLLSFLGKPMRRTT